MRELTLEKDEREALRRADRVLVDLLKKYRANYYFREGTRDTELVRRIARKSDYLLLAKLKEGKTG